MLLVGEGSKAAILDNGGNDSHSIEHCRIPDYIKERIALLKLCNIKKGGMDREVVGRRVSETGFYVYLTANEFRKLKQECNK